MKGKLHYLAISACLSIILCRLQFHPLLIVATIAFLIFLFVKNKRLLFTICFITILVFISIFLLKESQNKSSLIEGTYVTTGTFMSIPKNDGNQFSGYINNSDGEKLIFYYTINSLSEKKGLELLNPGNVCRFTGTLAIPKLPTMPNAFNFKQYLYDHKIHWQFQLDKIENCQNRKKDLMVYLLEIRKNGLEFIEAHFPNSSVGIVQALVFGERGLLNKDVESAYQELGVVHLLAISGLHVGLLVGAIYYILIFYGITHERSKIMIIVLLPIYMVLSGGAPSVLRASLMVILYFMLKLLKLKISSLDVICFTFLLLLFINPYYLFQIGFQLSYVVSFSLLLSSQIIGHFQGWFSKLAVVSSIAQLCAMPLLFYHFYEISHISLPMNMFFVPLYSFVVLPFAILSTFLTFIFPSFGTHVVQLLSEILQQTHRFVIFVSDIPYTKLTTGRLHTFLIMGLIYCIVFLFIQFERNKKLNNLFKPAIYLAVVISIQLLFPYINPYGKIMMINVGQGDSIFIQRPFNKGNYLIDTGGRMDFPKEEWQKTKNSFSIAEDITIPYFKSIGVTNLDALFLTHGDMDHIGETLKLMDEIKIKELIIPKGFVRGELEEKIIKTAIIEKIKIKTVNAGDQLGFNGFSFYVLSPQVLSASKNDDSLVLWTEIGGLKWLFTGDLEMKGEKRMLKTYPSLNADVLKVGHHGSKGSTSDLLLNKVTPSFALVSAGLNNRYQHPHSEVLKKFSVRKIPLLRTDLHGAIIYRFKGNNGTFSTHPPYDEVKE